MQSNIDQSLLDDDQKRQAAQQGAMVPIQSATNDPNAQTPSQGFLQQQAAQAQQQQLNSQQQAAPNPTPTGTVVPGQVMQANSPSIGQGTAPQPNGWTPPPGYMDGANNPAQQYNNPNNPANMSGVGQRGYAEGQLAAMGAMNAKDANSRANEQQTWQRQAVTKDQQIQAGMQQAGLANGYGGVVDYLRTADPERGLKIQQQKAELDQSMLKADSMASSNDLQKKQNLFDGYGLLGKMGATILQAPQDERQALYQQMLPMVKAVNPDAPDNVSDATPMFMLGAGQASPANALWAAKEDVNTSNSEVGKAQDDLTAALKAGYDPKSTYVQSLQAKVNQPLQDAAVKQHTVDNLGIQSQAAQSKANGDQFHIADALTKTYQANPAIKAATDYESSYQRFMAAQAEYKAHPGDPNAVTQMQAAAVTMNQIKRNNPQIMATMTATDSVMQEKMDQAQSWFDKNGKVIVSPTDVGRMSSLVQTTHDQIGQHAAPITNLYKGNAAKYGVQDQIPWFNSNGVQQQPEIPSRQQLDQTYQQAQKQSNDPTYQQNLSNWYQNKKSGYGYQ